MESQSLKSHFRHIITHLHPKGEDAHSLLRADWQRRITHHLTERGPLDTRSLSALRTWPEIAYVLAAGFLQSEAAMGQICQEPHVLLHILMAEYDLAAQYENFILGEGQGECIARLRAWARTKNRELHYPPAVYDEWLARDPFWAGTWLRSNPDAELAEKVACFAQECRRDDPGAAFAWLVTHREESVGDYTQILLQSPFYALVAMRAFPGKLSSALLLEEDLTPRWAYHLSLVPGGPDRALLEDSLIKDMGWLVEYCVDTGIHTSEGHRVAELYKRSVRLATETHHCCLEALHTWISRLTALHQTRSKQGAC